MSETKILKNNNSKTYNYGVDLIRIVAMFFVILVHSTTFYGFNASQIDSFGLFLVGIGRYLSFSCVPLFIMLTGYLNSQKEPTFEYYIKIFKILLEFVLCGLIVFTFHFFYYKNITFVEFFKSISNFSFPPYSWYINMYLGLFLLAPFFNYIVKGLTKESAILLVIILIIIFSRAQFTTYWTAAYPIMYYILGAIVKKYKINLNKFVLCSIILATCILQTFLSIHPIPKYSVENHRNLGCLIITVAIFLLLSNKTYQIVDGKKSKIFALTRTIANASLSTYLISSIFESITYSYFGKLNIITFADKLPYLLWITPIKFIASVIVGIAISLITNWLYKSIKSLTNKKDFN